MWVHGHSSRKEFVLEGYLELSEPPVHFSNANGRLLSIPDEFGDVRRSYAPAYASKLIGD